ncbi:hypothetical protein ABIA38_001031 [Embleya sp. AB8]
MHPRTVGGQPMWCRRLRLGGQVIARLAGLEARGALTPEHLRPAAAGGEVTTTLQRRPRTAREEGRTTPRPRPRFTITADLHARPALWGRNAAAVHRESTDQAHAAATHRTTGTGDTNTPPIPPAVPSPAPHITRFIDTTTKVVTRVAVTPGHPTRASTPTILRAAALRTEPYGPAGGVPENLRADRGKDFLSTTVTTAPERSASPPARSRPTAPTSKASSKTSTAPSTACSSPPSPAAHPPPSLAAAMADNPPNPRSPSATSPPRCRGGRPGGTPNIARPRPTRRTKTIRAMRTRRPRLPNVTDGIRSSQPLSRGFIGAAACVGSHHPHKRYALHA